MTGPTTKQITSKNLVIFFITFPMSSRRLTHGHPARVTGFQPYALNPWAKKRSRRIPGIDYRPATSRLRVSWALFCNILFSSVYGLEKRVYTFHTLCKGFCQHIFFAFSTWKCYLDIMPTEKPKIIFVAEQKLLERLDDFRFENRINSRSEAIRRLIDEGLKKYEKKAKE